MRSKDQTSDSKLEFRRLNCEGYCRRPLCQGMMPVVGKQTSDDSRTEPFDLQGSASKDGYAKFS